VDTRARIFVSAGEGVRMDAARAVGIVPPPRNYQPPCTNAWELSTLEELASCTAAVDGAPFWAILNTMGDPARAALADTAQAECLGVIRSELAGRTLLLKLDPALRGGAACTEER
jgi:hypothetical protein